MKKSLKTFLKSIIVVTSQLLILPEKSAPGARPSRAPHRRLRYVRGRRKVLDCKEQLGGHVGHRARLRELCARRERVRYRRRTYRLVGVGRL